VNVTKEAKMHPELMRALSDQRVAEVNAHAEAHRLADEVTAPARRRRALPWRQPWHRHKAPVGLSR
jgi:hypothetical protein